MLTGKIFGQIERDKSPRFVREKNSEVAPETLQKFGFLHFTMCGARAGMAVPSGVAPSGQPVGAIPPTATWCTYAKVSSSPLTNFCWAGGTHGSSAIRRRANSQGVPRRSGPGNKTFLVSHREITALRRHSRLGDNDDAAPHSLLGNNVVSYFRRGAQCQGSSV